MSVFAIKSHRRLTNRLSSWSLAAVSVLDLMLLQPDVRQPIFEPIKIRTVKRLIAPSGEKAEDEPAGGQTPRQRAEQDLLQQLLQQRSIHLATEDKRWFGCFITDENKLV